MTDIEIQIRVRRVHNTHRPVDDRQGLQAKEVELDEPYGLYIVLVELRDDVGPALLAIERRKIGQWPR